MFGAFIGALVALGLAALLEDEKPPEDKKPAGKAPTGKAKPATATGEKPADA
jgi:hypothetical protein